MIGKYFGLTKISDDEGTWKEGSPEAEKLFVMSAASQDQEYSGSDISIDSETLKTYRSNYKQVCKKKRSKKNDCLKQHSMSQKCFSTNGEN